MNAYGFYEQLQLNKYIPYEIQMNDVYLCGIRHQSQTYYLAIVDDTQNNPATCMRIQDVMYEIRSRFETKNLLIVVFSWDTDRVKTELGVIYGYWLYNVPEGRLMIYEDQPQKYLNVEELFNSENYSERTNRVRRPKYVDSNKKAMINYAMVLINIIIFMITSFQGEVTSAAYLASKGGMVPYLVTENHEYYRLFTSMFLHGSLQHIFSNMLVLTFTGVYLVRAVGSVKYLIIYLSSGLIGSLAALFYYNGFEPFVCCIGASGAIFGVIGALLYILVVNKGSYEDITLPRMIIYIILSVYIGIRSEGTCNAAHVGGLLAGIVLCAICYRKGEVR